MSDKKASQSVLAATRQELIDQLVAGYQRPARWCRRRIDPSCRKTLPHPNTPQTLAQCGIERAAAGSVKIGTLGQKHVSANNYLADSIAGRVNVNCGPRRRRYRKKTSPAGEGSMRHMPKATMPGLGGPGGAPRRVRASQGRAG